MKGKKVTLVIGARKSTHEGMVYPYNFGANNFGQCAHYIAYEVVLSAGKKSICYTYSSSTPPLEVRVEPNGELVPNTCDSKLLNVTESFLNWIVTHPEGINLWAILQSEKEKDECSKYDKIIEQLLKQSKSSNLKVWKFDLDEFKNAAHFEKNFDDSTLQFGVMDVVSKHKVIDLSEHPMGVQSTKKLTNGHFHITVFSLQRSGYMFHSSIWYSCVSFLLEEDSLTAKECCFSALVSLSLELEYRLFVLYDRGRAKHLTVAQMAGHFNQPNVSKTKNANTCMASKTLKDCITLDYSRQRLVFKRAKEGMFTVKKARVAVISWYVAGYSPSSPDDIIGILGCFDKNNMPDLIAIGLQEVVELKSSNIARFFTNNSKENDEWVRCFAEVIKKYDPNYEVRCFQRMVGLFSLTLVHKRFAASSFDLGITEVKTGFMGIVGNKGSVITSMMLGDSLVHFCNTHLPSGDSVGKRASCVEDLYKEFCAGEGCDTFFLFGDLNMRVQIDLLVYKDIMEDFKINNPRIDFAGMMAKDEVKLNLHPCLDDHFEEAPLPRAPTYRFIKNTEEYSEERVASW